MQRCSIIQGVARASSQDGTRTIQPSLTLASTKTNQVYVNRSFYFFGLLWSVHQGRGYTVECGRSIFEALWLDSSNSIETKDYVVETGADQKCSFHCKYCKGSISYNRTPLSISIRIKFRETNWWLALKKIHQNYRAISDWKFQN